MQMYTDKNVTSPPPRDLLLEVARTKNTSTLPIPKPTSGLRLPPDRFCLTSCNFKLKSSKKQPPRSGPYYYGSATASTASQMRNEGMKNKVNKRHAARRDVELCYKLLQTKIRYKSHLKARFRENAF